MALTKQDFRSEFFNEVQVQDATSNLANPPSTTNPAASPTKKSTARKKAAHFDNSDSAFSTTPHPENIENNNPVECEDNNINSFDADEANNLDYHVRAGRIGGQTTKQRHRDSNFYREIGARGGSSTMAKHAQEYEERRKKGGETTRERYGEEYYHSIAEKAARVKQDATRLRNEAIKALLGEGWKIPTIIKLTLNDLQNEPRLQKHLETGPVAEYLRTRPETSVTEVLFISQSGKPLSLANTYTVMERHRP